MAVDMNRLTKARQLWPKQTANLAAPVQAFYHAWEQCREADQDAALETIEGFTLALPVVTAPSRSVEISHSCAPRYHPL
jgi:hypothetical protein